MDYEVLHTLPFDSIRKRMSIVVRHPHTSQIITYCKGADSAIFSHLKTPSEYWAFVTFCFIFETHY